MKTQILLLLWLVKNILLVCQSLFIYKTHGHILGTDYQVGLKKKKKKTLQLIDMFPSFSRKVI